ncbi:hypothetical protein RsTz2092_04370 [Deferribacterales bacterium RsTz2092]|nr:hypothetical protein AGMMS49941_01670 [Deferribacterales bacterium]
MESIFYLVLGVVAVIIYLLPFILAKKRNMASARTLFWVNLFLGVTGLVWLVCLIWACEGRTKESNK